METQSVETDKEQLSPELLNKMNAYCRAANYLSVGQIYLHVNPLLREPLKPENIRHMLLVHWGTTPGQNFIYLRSQSHHKKICPRYDLHIRPWLWRTDYCRQCLPGGNLQRSISNISQDEEGLKKLFTQFSFPVDIPSHVSPECPESIHEGGELGYSLSHALKEY